MTEVPPFHESRFLRSFWLIRSGGALSLALALTLLAVPALAETDASADGGADAGAPADAAPDAVPLADTAPLADAGPAEAALPLPSTPLPPLPPAQAAVQVSELTVVGTRERQTAGSAHILKARDLERFDHDDPQQVLKQVPGVYSRGEDGVGLRPNIGIRGVNPDRSKKVTLMEDGVLFGPAPYSAPAAYYFPLVTRMEAVRVIKGPGAVVFGPQTVGGAIDFVTRRVPNRFEAGVDLAGGQYGYGKAHAFLGASNRRVGFVLEGVHLRSSGFKDLDGGGDTGFARNELMGKLRFVLAPGARVHNELQLKLGFSNEDSDETYLGLTDEDFRRTPLRRYGSSHLDHMEWHRLQGELRHAIDFGGGRSIDTVVYRHDLSRTWNKVNRFRGTDIPSVLRDPTGRNRVYYEVLSGQRDSSTVDEELFIGPNDREFVAQGIQSVASLRLGDGDFTQRLELGARLHHDRIDRLHSESPYLVRAGRPERAPGPTEVTANGRDQALALALNALDAITWKNLTVTPGLRLELIHTESLDRRSGQKKDGAPQRVLIPGVGAYYALTPVFGVLGGVYRGFSPAAPGQPDEVDPETSWNYEAGVRAGGARGRAEVIGFFNDYRNLTSNCTFAAGCTAAQIDRQYDAGRARIWGFEAFGTADFRPLRGVTVPVLLAYTFTRTRLLEDFSSDDPQLGKVESGFELPYVPRHQAALTLGLETARIGFQTALTYTSRMREQAGDGPFPPDYSTDPNLVLEAGVRVYVLRSAHLYAQFRNITNAADIASRRPFGARPISPLWIQVGVKAAF